MKWKVRVKVLRSRAPDETAKRCNNSKTAFLPLNITNILPHTLSAHHQHAFITIHRDNSERVLWKASEAPAACKQQRTFFQQEPH